MQRGVPTIIGKHLRQRNPEGPNGPVGAPPLRLTALDREAQQLLVVTVLWALGTALANTFVSAYLWRMQAGYRSIGVYYVWQYAWIAIGFVVAGWLMKRINRMWVWRLGVLAMGAAYLTVLRLGPSAAQNTAWLGLLTGWGTGIYWLAYHVLSYDTTTPLNRSRFISFAGAMQALGNTIGPAAAGFFLARFVGASGYAWLFGATVGLYAIAIALSFRLSAPAEPARYELGLVLRASWRPGWRHVLLAHVGLGLRDGLSLFLLTLLVFVATGSELSLGQFAFWIGAANTAVFYASAWVLRRLSPTIALWLGAAGIALGPWPLLAGLEMPALIASGLITAVATPLLWVPSSTIMFQAIAADPRAADLRGEYLVVRELALNVGRVTSLGLFLLWASVAGQGLPGLLALMLCTQAAALGAAWALAKAARVTASE